MRVPGKIKENSKDKTYGTKRVRS